MRKLLRNWLGIEQDKKDNEKNLKIICEAVDRTFNLKKKDKSILGMTSLILCEEFDKTFAVEKKGDGGSE